MTLKLDWLGFLTPPLIGQLERCSKGQRSGRIKAFLLSVNNLFNLTSHSRFVTLSWLEIKSDLQLKQKVDFTSEIRSAIRGVLVCSAFYQRDCLQSQRNTRGRCHGFSNSMSGRSRLYKPTTERTLLGVHTLFTHSTYESSCKRTSGINARKRSIVHFTHAFHRAVLLLYKTHIHWIQKNDFKSVFNRVKRFKIPFLYIIYE